MEESIVTGNIIGWHANNREDFSYFLDINKSISIKDDTHPSHWKKFLVIGKHLNHLMALYWN